MAGRITRFALVTLVCTSIAASAAAQQPSAQGVRRVPLGQRLQRLRSELFGEMPRRGAPSEVGQQQLGSPQPVVQMPAEAEAVEAEVNVPATPLQAAPPTPSGVKVPPYLQRQGARRARSSATADGATRNLRARMAPMRRRAPDHHPPTEAPPYAGPAPHAGGAPYGGRAADAEPAPHEYQGEAMVDPAAGEPEWDDAVVGDSRYPGSAAFEPTDEPIDIEETRVARRPEEATGDEARYADQENSESSESFPGAAQSPDDGAQSLEEPAEPLDDGALSPEEPAAGDDESGDALDGSTEPIDTGSSSFGEAGGSLDHRPALDARDARSDVGTDDVLFTTESPVLSVEATGPRTVLIGKPAEFVVKVRNSGAAANQVVISIDIPSYAEVAGARPTAGTAQPAAEDGLEWTIDRLDADSSHTLTLELVPRKSSPLDLSVRWTFTPEAAQTMVEVQEPKLVMNVAGPTEVLYGETKVYKLTISNPGNGDAENVTIGLLPVGRSGEASANHRLGTLAAGESKTIDIELTARQAGAVAIKAHAFADGGLRAEAAEQVLVRRASLQVEVEAPRIKYAGTEGTFRVKVENVGDATADNVRVAAILPPETRFIAASSGGRHQPEQAQVEWSAASLQPGGRRVYELQCALGAPGENRMQFTAVADGELSAAATSNTRVEAIADLKLEVADPKGPIPVGEEAVYEIRIRNRGTKAAEGVDLAIFFSEGLEATSADGGPHDIGTGQVVFRPIASIAAGGSAVFHIRARADSGGNLVFRAEVTCESLGTKLATEEATHFYGEPPAAATGGDEPHVAARPGGPTPAAPSEGPTPADPGRPAPRGESSAEPSAE